MPSGSVRFLVQKAMFYLRMDPMQPSLGVVGLLAVRCNLCLKLFNPVLGSMKLMR
jgi:hypothetical protein